jgi:hypothetical protein
MRHPQTNLWSPTEVRHAHQCSGAEISIQIAQISRGAAFMVESVMAIMVWREGIPIDSRAGSAMLRPSYGEAFARPEGS